MTAETAIIILAAGPDDSAWQRKRLLLPVAGKVRRAGDWVHYLRGLAGHSRLDRGDRFVEVPKTQPPTMDVDLPADYERCLRDWSDG